MRPVRQDPFELVTHLSDLQGAWCGLRQLDRLRLFADAYGWLENERRRLPEFGAERACLTWERMKHNAENRGGGWARMWSEGVGEVIRRRRTWLLNNADAIRSALLD